MLVQLFKALLPKPDVVLLYLSTLAPLAAVIFSLWLDRRWRAKVEKPPQDQKLLRPPGYTLSVKLDETLFDSVSLLLTASLLSATVIAFGFATITLLAAPIPWYWSLIPASVSIASISGVIYVVRRTLHQFGEAMNYRLGLRGEQAVAEILHEVADCGYRAFHDLPGGDDWNIDHIVVGAQGVFAIETKARMKRWSCKDQKAHVVRFDARSLVFPWRRNKKFVDYDTINQAERNARWLGKYLYEKTGERVTVEPLVVLPGWWTEKLPKSDAKECVMSAVYLAGYLRRQPQRLPAAQVRRIITAVEEKCRDVDF